MLRRPISLFALTLAAGLLTARLGSAQSAPTKLAPSQLQPDARLLRSVLDQLHPGLYRHVDSIEIAKRFAALEAQWAKPQTLPDAYRDLSITLAAIRDAHTYANPNNQSKTVQTVLFGRATCVPFHFRLIDKRMIVTSALDSLALPRGTEVTRINDNSITSVLDTLLAATRGDGANDANRLSRLEVTGLEANEAFDMLLPLFLPVGRTFALEVKVSDKANARAVTVPAVVARTREATLSTRRGGTPSLKWHLNSLDGRTIRLTFPDFVTWRDPKFDWKKWLADSFNTIRQLKADAVILDVRQCEGGNDEVVTELLRYLAPKPFNRAPERQLWRVDHFDPSQLSFLDTWNPKLKTMTAAEFAPTSDGFFERLSDRAARVPVRPYPQAFTGKVYALCGPRNSSAAFQLLRELQTNHIATLVGQPTGGNRRGTTGGQFVMLRLPNTGFEVDVPLIAYSPIRAQPDQGLEPDEEVALTVEDLRAGHDPEMARVRELLRDERTER
jgi:Peptidase family S41